MLVDCAHRKDGCHRNGVRQISGWAAIIAVPTFPAGARGMHFKHMPEPKWQIGDPLAPSTMLLAGVTPDWILRRTRRL